MADKQLIQTFWNIRKECKKHDDCYKCIFGKKLGSSSNCQLMELIETLSYDAPCRWNMEKIEQIIGETE